MKLRVFDTGSAGSALPVGDGLVRAGAKGAAHPVDSLIRPVDGMTHRSRAMAYPVDGIAHGSDAMTDAVVRIAYRSDAITSPVDGITHRSDGIADPVHGMSYPVRAIEHPVDAISDAVDATWPMPGVLHRDTARDLVAGGASNHERRGVGEQNDDARTFLHADEILRVSGSHAIRASGREGRSNHA